MRNAILALAVATALVACADDSGPRLGSTGQVVLHTPGTEEGALLLEIAGPGAVAVSTVSAGHTVFTTPLDGGGVRVALVGDLSNGSVLEIEVGGDLSDYDAVLEQIAARDDHLRESQAGYRLTIEPIHD